MTGLFEYRNKIVRYSDEGRGDAIVLLHGYLETSEIWVSFAEELSESHRVISPDFPGHGGSDMFARVHTMELMAEIIKALLDYLAIDKVFLVGHSMGGYVTLAFAELFPEKLFAYSLFHSHPFADSPETIRKRKEEIALVNAGRRDDFSDAVVAGMFAADSLDNLNKALKKSKEIAASVSNEGIIAVLEGMIKRPSRLNVMEKGDRPCLWILGEQDSYISCREIQTKVRLPGNAELLILQFSGHMGFIEEKGKSLEAIEKFFLRISKPV